MILVDTSVWADHFRRNSEVLLTLLKARQVLGHPFVVGELAMGNLARRQETLSDLAALQTCVVAETAEILRFIEQERLYGTGVGFVDAHLLVSVRLTPGAYIWTNDKRLGAVADRLSLRAKPLH